MDKRTYIFPEYMSEIIKIVREKDWVVHNFNSNSKDITYNPPDYLRNIEIGESTYDLILDLNVFQYIVNAVKKDNKNENYISAIALLIFCQQSNIDIDPRYFAYEKINHNPQNANEVIKDLNIFYCLNNTDPNYLISYIQTSVSKLDIEIEEHFDQEKLKNDLLKYERLNGWNSLYLMVLYLTYINQKDLSKINKLKKFIEWSISDYRLSLVAVVYASILFSEFPLKKMMKYKKTDTKERKNNAISNMTWDLYIMSEYFTRWVGKKDLTKEYLFASNDKAFKELLKKSIEIQNSGSFIPIKGKLNSSCFEYLEIFINQDNSKKERVYGTSMWGIEHRTKLIKKYEDLVLL
jgi:hypothetical protein